MTCLKIKHLESNFYDLFQFNILGMNLTLTQTQVFRTIIVFILQNVCYNYKIFILKNRYQLWNIINIKDIMGKLSLYLKSNIPPLTFAMIRTFWIFKIISEGCNAWNSQYLTMENRWTPNHSCSVQEFY